MSQLSMTFTTLMDATISQPTSSLEDSPVRVSPVPGSDEARRMTVTSGLRCTALLRRTDPVWCWLRMCLVSSRWRSSIVLLLWKPTAWLLRRKETYIAEKDEESGKLFWRRLKCLDTPARRFLFQLVPSVPRTGGRESGLWPTLDSGSGRRGGQHPARINPMRTFTINDAVRMWPTPRANERSQKNSADSGVALSKAVQMWPTPRANLVTTVTEKGSTRRSGNLEDAVAATINWPTPRSTQTGGADSHGVMPPEYREGSLNPQFVEWLMGYPVGWTDCEPSETP